MRDNHNQDTDQPLPKPTSNQDYILTLIFKFRFITTYTLAKYRNQSDHTVAYRSLEKLKDHGYLLKRYNNYDKIDRKSAIYSLSKIGIKYLRDAHKFNESALHAMYKNHQVTTEYTESYIELLELFNQLKRSYPLTFDIFSSVELIDQDYFPEPRPDLYLRRRDLKLNVSNEYFLYAVSDVQLFVIKKRLKSWLTHFDEEGWDGDYPTILLVCGTQSIENRTRTYLVGLELEDELRILTTTKKSLLESDTSEIWMDYRTDQMLMSLNS